MNADLRGFNPRHLRSAVVNSSVTIGVPLPAPWQAPQRTHRQH